MSLNPAQMGRTADELAANFHASGLTLGQLAELTGLSPERTAGVLALDPRSSSPEEVWLVRDKLETAVREDRGDLTPYSVLTEQARTAAAGWFGVRDER